VPPRKTSTFPRSKRRRPELRLGAHLSVAGGLHQALERARAYGFDTVALFVRNQVQWACPPLSEEAAERFRRARQQLGIDPVIAHGSYLVNLAGRPEIRDKSIAAVREDLARCARLEIDALVLHPGTCENVEKGIRLIADALNAIIPAGSEAGPMILLETTAGKGNGIGHTFEHLANILRRLDCPERFGVCLDTCHVFAAGYDLRSAEAYARTMEAFDRLIGLKRLRAIHLNDSQRDLGSRVDRHAHIGAGRIGRAGFSRLVNDPRLRGLPMIMETPKGTDAAGDDWDAVNARAILRLRRRQ